MGAFLLAEAQHWWMMVPVRYFWRCDRQYATLYSTIPIQRSLLGIPSVLQPASFTARPRRFERILLLELRSPGRRATLVPSGVARSAQWQSGTQIGAV